MKAKQEYIDALNRMEVMPLITMKEKGYFKNVDKNELIKDILENCEVIKND